MLTKQLAIAHCDFRRSRIVPDRLTRQAHGHYLGLAERMIAIYRAGVGRTANQLHCAVRELFANQRDCPPKRVAAFCKLLDDASTFERAAPHVPVALRREVFQLAGADHPLWRTTGRPWSVEADALKARIARKLGRPWDEIGRLLFQDAECRRRLEAFAGFRDRQGRTGQDDARSLLSRYNVSQVQVTLLSAERMTVWAGEDFKTILRYAKLARLMHTVTRGVRGTYCFQFDGPASLLRATRRYGLAMARFLPSLVACHNWRLHAVVRTPRRAVRLTLDLSSNDGLISHLPRPQAFDSRVEEAFARQWGSAPRDGWQLVREGEPLHRGQKVFLPDFVLRRDDGRRVLMEIVGFWTPEYLAAKANTLQIFRYHPILLAVAAHATEAMPPMAIRPVVFRTRIRLEDILARLAEIERSGRAAYPPA